VVHADRQIRSLMAERRSIYNQVTERTNRISPWNPAAADHQPVYKAAHEPWFGLGGAPQLDAQETGQRPVQGAMDAPMPTGAPAVLD